MNNSSNFLKYLALGTLSFMFMFAVVALAQDAGVTPPSSDELNAFFKSLLTLKGAGGMFIVGTIIQGLLLFFRSSLAKFAGIYQLLIISGLNVVGMIIVNLATGKGLAGILMDAPLLVALQVFFHQVYTQVKKLPADQAAAAK